MISVCMATYNGEKYIKEQISSILSEIGWEDELIVSDDNSTDMTIDIIKSFKDPRIQLFINPGPSGVNKNFENALKKTNGDIIFFSDQDDIWLPGKVKACKDALTKCDCVFHDAIVIDSDGKVISTSFCGDKIPSGSFWKNLWKTSYMGCRMAINKRALNYVLPYPDKILCFQEGWVASMIAIKSKVNFIDFKGIKYRRHGSNLSCTTGKSPYSFIKKLSFRVNLLFNVTKRLLKII